MLLMLRGALLVSVLCTVTRVSAQQRGLFPAILNLASQATISSNATCGQSGPEEFCKLVEHVSYHHRFQQKNLQCRICDDNTTGLAATGTERHPIGNVIDGTNNWWQSPSIANGREFHWVTVTLDLRQLFQIAYIIIKAANSPRPGNWILERSEDGVTYEPWQYYAISDTECLSRYNITPRRGPPTYKSDHEVICTSYYSKLVPLEHGEIHTSLINGRPSADHLTPELLSFTSARFIRLRFQRIRNLNADLMMLSHRDPKEVDPIVTRRYFYSIKDVSVGGMCICFGHAQSCPRDPVTQKFKCVCEHNTCGESCNQCCPGYHQEAWQPGTLSVGNTCEKCNCHNKGVECVYNRTVADLGLSLDTHGRLRGGGVCLDCTQHTAGINCEWCKPGYYRPSQVSPYSDFPCLDCQCDLRGSESSVCIKDDEYARLGLPAGQCVCREGFAGRQCDRCAFGYRDFPQCVPCQCNLAGSTNTDPCAPCVCKANVMGSLCDLCKSGFFNLQSSNPDGCTGCFCFGISEACESSDWSMSQIVAGEASLLPSQVDSAPVVESNDLVVPGNGSSSSSAYQHVMSWTASDNFLGNRLLSYGGHLTFSLLHDIPLDNEDHFVPAQCDIIIEGNGKTLRHSSSLLLLSSGRPVSVSVAMTPGSFVHLDVHSGRDVHASRHVLMSVLSDLASLRVKVHLNTDPLELRLSKVSLDIADHNSANRLQAVAVESCECPWGYTGTSCESCIPGFYREGGVLYGGECLQCECNEHASECDINGVCQDCAHYTTGSHCEQCVSGFYGDATEGTPDDCKRCACPLTVATNNFSPTCVLVHPGKMSCDRCQEGYTGTRCERCADGFHGNPAVAGGTCARCECNGNVDAEEAGHCDHVTGECLRCRGNTTGWHCQTCQDGFYGDAVVAKDCRECGCDVNGALSRQCNVTTGQCDCKQNVVGRTCDSCQVGFFGLVSGHGCGSCNCSQPGALSESCDEKGRCQCVEGMAGDKCDRCAHGYYDDQGDGCKACDCAHTHGNCNPATGVCICPPHTEGAKCENCTAGFWGHDPKTGCQSCDCSVEGSSSPQCDLTNGQCPCLAGFSGRSCERCALGYHGYPACTACGCDPAGTQEEFCNQTTGVCGCLATGQCVCKASVGGRGCEECVLGTFGLWAGHPSGCSNCYCSGRSQRCEELSGMTRVPISVGDEALSVVSQSEQQGALLSGVFQHDGDNVLDTRELSSSPLTGPLYWKLPAQYEGNQMLSYGGLLSYDSTFYAEDSAGLANQEPQVLIRGGTFRKLMIYTDVVAPAMGVRTRHDVSMTEHQWRYFNSVWEEPVSRHDFMMVLSSVQFVMIKASYGTALLQSRISNITMETAVEEEGLAGSEVRGGVARLIESCDCPPGYAGLSCQECSPGFYRGSVHSSQGRRTWVRPCLPCQCNDHSNTCDLETGECQACQHNTTGSHCDLCAPGHYGKVTGSISDCSLCACPLKDQSFSSTCVLEAESGGFRCDACQTGYEGRHCESCAAGFHGDPSSPGGACSPCSCGRGSLSDLCDPVTGGCQCKAGFKGQLCDQCDDRFALEGDQCISCDDECTGVLLDDLEASHSHAMLVNVTGLSLAPYSLLVALERQSGDIQTSMLGVNRSERVLSSEEQMTALVSDVTALLERAANLSSEAEETGVAIDQSISQGALLLDTIGTLNDNIQVLVVETGLLNRTQEEELESTNHTHLLEEVAAMLDDIRTMNLTLTNATATDEHSLSASLLQRVQLDFVASRAVTERSSEQLSVSLTQHTRALQDARTLLHDAQARNNHTHARLDDTHTQLQQYQSLYQGLLLVNESLEMEQLLTDAFSHTEYLLHINTTAQLESYSEEVEQWRPLLRKHVDTLVMGLKRTNALNSVYQTEDHAHTLHALTHNFTSSLALLCNTSQHSIAGIHGNRSVWVIESALETATQADTAATHTLNMTVQSEQPLAAEGGAAVNLSQSVLEQSRLVNNSAHDLLVKVTRAATRLGLVKEGVCNASQLLSQPISKLSSLGNDSRSVIQEARQQVAVAQSDLQDALQRLDQLTKRLELSSTVVEQTNITVSNANAMMSHSHTTANEAQRKLNEAERRTERLIDRMKPLRILGETLSRNLSDIRQLINQARRQAASIKVAVQSDRNCVRSYRPEVQTSNFNSVSLTVKTAHPDNLLFYMGSSTQVDFLAVQMHAGKVSMLWDAGSGPSRVEYPHLLISNNKWTRINATRFGGRGSLSVYQSEEGTESVPPSVATASSPGPTRILDVDNNTLIHIGGLPTHSKVSSAVTQSSFEGCLGEVSVNGRNVGLWNYSHREGTCSGCFTSPQSEDTAFHYDGTGFSVVVKSLRATSTSVTLQFKTLSPNGLLLYLASNGTRDFLSIELVDGRVRLTFDLGGGALTLTSRTAYNSGVWFKINLQRNKRKGYLSIWAADQSSEKEVLEAESPGKAADLNRSDLDPIYIGGLPASRPIRRQVVSRSFIGCIKDVEIANSYFDLLRDAYGVKKGCVLEAVRSVSILKAGYVQLSAVPPFHQQGEILLTFATNNHSGTLLAAFSKVDAQRGRRQTKQSYLAVQLVAGGVEAELAVGGVVSGVVVVKPRPGSSLSDGKPHSLIITLDRKILSVQVDEDLLESAPLSLGGVSLSLSSVFIGGLPAGQADALPIRFRDAARSFRGCIQNLALEGMLVDLSGAVRYEGAVLDRCLLEEKDVGAVLPDEQEAEPTPEPVASPPTAQLSALTPGSLTCASGVEPSFLPSAKQFGLSRHSHMTFTINPNNIRKSFSLGLSLRTHAENGLILYLSNDNHMDYTILQLVGGRLVFTVGLGKGQASARSSGTINDGQWHTVVCDLARKSISISVDGGASDSVSVKGNTLDVSSTLYLGGVPHSHPTKRTGNVSNSLSSCVRSVSLGGDELDLSSPASQHHTTSCFTNQQTGSYFNGSGHAMLVRDGYKVGSDMTVSLDFRTSQSEAVLLGISSAKVDAIGLEIVNGQVYFHVNNGAGRVSVRSAAGRGVCDDLWHHLVATKTKHRLSLALDGVITHTPNPHPQSTSAETNNPVYLGGYPGGVRQNCLSSTSWFRGCMKNVRLVKGHVTQDLDLSSASSLSGVTAGACPA